MSKIVRVNYDELQAILKKLNGEAEDVAVLHSTTIQRVNALRKEWVGEAADRFFNEMDGQLIPALGRLTNALIFTQDVLSRIMRIIYENDAENAAFFENSEWGEEFGAGLFGGALGALLAQVGIGSSGNSGSEINVSAGPPEGSASSAGVSTSPGGEGMLSPVPTLREVKTDELQPAEEVPATDSESSGASGGSGGGSSSGLQGDLKRLGESLGGAPDQSAFVGGSSGGVDSIPDHTFETGVGGSSVVRQDGVPFDSSGSGGVFQAGEDQPSIPGVPGIAAGAAGIAGSAAAAAAIKAANEKKES